MPSPWPPLDPVHMMKLLQYNEHTTKQSRGIRVKQSQLSVRLMTLLADLRPLIRVPHNKEVMSLFALCSETTIDRGINLAPFLGSN